MKPAGVIATYMSRQDWKGKSFWIKVRTMIFNLCLLIGQLIFMIVGTVYGKIRWGDRPPSVIALCCLFIVWIPLFLIPQWWLRCPLVIFWLCLVVATIRNIPWRRVWRAAQCSHVRLCLRDVGVSRKLYIVYEYINFGYPKAELQDWRMDMIDGKRFQYLNPTFPTPPEFMEPVIQYAEDQVGKPYDTLQLFSYGLNFVVWLFWWKKWGKEVFRWLNLRGGREVCSSGMTADLRWADVRKDCSTIITVRVLENDSSAIPTRFFKGYDTAVVPPCLIAIDENWEEE